MVVEVSGAWAIGVTAGVDEVIVGASGANGGAAAGGAVDVPGAVGGNDGGGWWR